MLVAPPASIVNHRTTMARSFHQNIAHIIFSTKNRHPLITGEYESDLHSYLGAIIRKLNGTALKINGTADHVHILAKTPKTIANTEFMAKLKANSTSWVKSNFEDTKSFAWQEGYGWFSVSRSNVDQVSACIEGQEEHHRSTTFKEEFLAFLERHEVEYDGRFVWE